MRLDQRWLFLSVLGILSLAKIVRGQSWDARFSGPAGEDRATAVTTDSKGNVYVTGYSARAGGAFGYLTISYTADGQLRWERRYDGSGTYAGQGNHRAFALALRGGFVYVTGQSWGGPVNGHDWATLKLDSATGELSGTWPDIEVGGDGNIEGVRRYSGGPDQGSLGPTSDRANAIATDSRGAVYPAGRLVTPFHFEYGALKYDADGALSPSWLNLGDGVGVRRYRDRRCSPQECDEIFAVSLDENDAKNPYLYVTGTTWNSCLAKYDYGTLKYRADDGALSPTWPSEDGSPAGVRRFRRNPSEGYNGALAVQFDDASNVYVTGYVGHLRPHPLFCRCTDYGTLAYSASGTLKWSQFHDGSAQDEDRATALGLDSAGNVFVTGFSEGRGNKFGYATLKYGRETGDFLWEDSGEGRGVRRYDASGNLHAAALALAVDAADNLYVTGGSEGPFFEEEREDPEVLPESFRAFATVKYDGANGAPLWVDTYDNGGASGIHCARGVAVDNDPERLRVVVTGLSFGEASGLDYATLYRPQ